VLCLCRRGSTDPSQIGKIIEVFNWSEEEVSKSTENRTLSPSTPHISERTFDLQSGQIIIRYVPSGDAVSKETSLQKVLQQVHTLFISNYETLTMQDVRWRKAVTMSIYYILLSQCCGNLNINVHDT
jgi:hypothetical protein